MGRTGSSSNIHREIVHTFAAPRIAEAVMTVAVVVDAIARVEQMDGSINREPECSALDGDVFPRAESMRIKQSGIHACLDASAHKFKLNSR